MAICSTVVKKVSEIIRKVCNPLVRDFHEIQRLQGSQNLSLFVQTTCDRLESKLLDQLGEYNTATGSTYEIVVFPIDGRDNFLRGMPEFTLSVLLKKNNKAVAAVIESPMSYVTFYAEHSQGAYLEDLGGTMRLKMKNFTDTSNLVALLNCAESRFNFSKPRILGCESLSACYVAAGRGDILLINTSVINANLLLLVRLLLAESGGKELHFDNKILFAHLDLCNRFKSLLI